MKIIPTQLDGFTIVESESLGDHRGVFTRWFCEQELSEILEDRRIIQINRSRTETPGAVRGLHFQRPPHAEMKLIRCIRGSVWDVAVDLREGSPTFLNWHAEKLTEFDNKMAVIPEGFAHGFQVLAPSSELLYLHTAAYQPEAEDGIRFNDPLVGINWPMEVSDLSDRDQSHALMEDSSFDGVVL